MTILCYHTVDEGWRSSLAVRPSTFRDHCALLASRRSVIDLSSAVTRMGRSGNLPRGQAALTFDDGFAALLEHALPHLVRHRLPATVFLVASTRTADGHPVDWVDDAPTPAPQTLDLEQVLEMQKEGISFGSHSYAHRDLTSLSEEECERDLRASRELLEDLLGRPVPCLAYPRGLHDRAVHRAVRKAGYKFAFSLSDDRFKVSDYALPRVGIYRGNGSSTLRIKSSWWYPRLRRSRTWQMSRRRASSLLNRVNKHVTL